MSDSIERNSHASLRIMSNNIWWCDSNNQKWTEMGYDCSAKNRASGFMRVYSELLPDIIGLQECSAAMCHELMTALSEKKLPYTLIWGRDTPIIFRCDKFELLYSDALIYPEEIPQYEGCFNNAKTKSYCIAVFRTKEKGKNLIFATTHLWYKSSNPSSAYYQPFSDEARMYQVSMLIDKIEELKGIYNAPSIFVGDLNSNISSLACTHAIKCGYTHARDLSIAPADKTSGMHSCDGNGFDRVIKDGGFESSIDHIFIKGKDRISVKCYNRFCEDYYMPLSDHLPLWIDIDLI